MTGQRIYLDHHATTPVDPRVLEAMLPYFREDFGNAASKTHTWGGRAEEAVEEAREAVAAVIGARARELVWTSGATESINLALKGLAAARKDLAAARKDLAAARKGDHTTRDTIVTCTTEHKAVLDTAIWLQAQGLRVVVLPVDEQGVLDLDRLAGMIDERTLVVSLMHANNEIGTVHPLAEVGRLCRAHGACFHVDAAQTLGKLPIDVEAMGIDLLSATAHKLYGPKGVGVLYVRSKRPRVEIQPLIHGGGHERGMRSGTLNVPGAAGFGAAAAIAAECMQEEGERLAGLRDLLHAELAAQVDGLCLNGHPTERLPANLNLSFPGCSAEALLLRVPEVAASSGSACTSATQEPSHVLRALGLPPERLHSSVRFGLGRGTTEDDVRYAAARFAEETAALRAMSPTWGG